jgi:site-specific DNA-methyltransferase (adenine-specific)
MSTFELKNIDCLEYIKTMPDNSVDCIITDPPYFEIKGDFDFVFKSFDEYLEWVKLLAVEFQRILKPNGSLLWFGDDKNIAYCQVIFDKHFNFLNHLVWDKINPICKGEANFRKFATRTERILYYANTRSKTGLEEIKEDVNNFKSLREYALKVRVYCDYSRARMLKVLKHHGSQHFLEPKGPQWELPTPETYKELIDVFGIDKMEGFREYEALRQEYEALRRPFNYQLGVYEILRQQNHHNETFFITGKESHATVKPLKLMQRLIELTTNENNIVFDPFMGSGTTGIACMNLKRNFIGTELDTEYFEIAKKRVEKAYYSKNVEIKNDIIDLSEYRPRGESQLRFFK